ncbi:MAG: mechanosensitive ion channel [Rickettsiaceae bacterium]|nr:mechanosensitive ion channel [Rickettsiaceae bacterium]
MEHNILPSINFDGMTQVEGLLKESIWQKNILTIDNNQVTVGNIVSSLLIFFVGMIYLSYIKKRLSKFISQKFPENQDTANTVENLIIYCLIILFVTIVLKIANIPLSAFAFIGGALAIGVGFGAQHLIGNLISSLIIMIEKPVKIGDYIQIDDIKGTVIAIGSRCITIQNEMYTHVLIPNSSLLQKNLINSTFMNDDIKGFINLRFYKNESCKIGSEQNGQFVSDNLGSIGKKSKKEYFSPSVIQHKIIKVLSLITPINNSDSPKVYFKGSDYFCYCFQVFFTCSKKQVKDLKQFKTDLYMKLGDEFDFENMMIENE